METAPPHPQNSHNLQRNEQSLYKGRLQQYALRAGLGLPTYHIMQTGQPKAPAFKCSVTVGEETYESPSTCAQKKAAEHDAAKCAFKAIFEKRVEKGSFVMSMLITLCKTMLNEFSAKLQVEKPKYDTIQIQGGLSPVFVSTVEFRGVSYTGGPSKTKKNAEQSVAHDALISILGDSEVGLTLLENLISKAKVVSSLQIWKGPNSCAIKPVEVSNPAAGGGASSGQFVFGSLIATTNKEQFKDATNSKFCALQMQSAPVHPMQTLANEGCQIISASQSVVPVPYSSQADGSVFLLHPLSPNHTTTPAQVIANHDGIITPASQAHGSVIQVVQSDSFVLPKLPENFTAPSQNVADHSGKVTFAPQAVVGLENYYPPEETPILTTTAVPLVQDGSAALSSQLAGKRNRGKSYKAKKKARMAPSFRALKPEEGPNSTGNGASSGQLVSESDALIAVSNEEQFKEANASHSPALQTQGAPVPPLIQNHATPPMKTPSIPPVQVSANEGCKVSSASQTDGPVFLVPCLSPNPSTTPVQVLVNPFAIQEGTSSKSPGCGIKTVLPGNSTTPLQNVEDHSGKVTFAPQAVVELEAFHPLQTRSQGCSSGKRIRAKRCKANKKARMANQIGASDILAG